MSDNSLYAVLGIAPDADPTAIEAAFHSRQQALQGRPDELSLLRIAYDTLRQPDRRAAYDRKLASLRTEPMAIAALHDIPRPRRKRSRLTNWLALILAAAFTIGFFWWQKPAAKRVVAPAAAPVTTQPPTDAKPPPAVAATPAKPDPEPVPASPAGEAPAPPSRPNY